MMGHRIFCGCAAATLSSRLVHAETAPASADPALIEDLVAANHILG